MTIRSGGRPRDGRAPASPAVRPRRLRDRDRSPSSREPSRAVATVGGGRGRAAAWSGLLKFLVFALVLAAIVLAVALTALRPIVTGAILGVAEDNPAALQLPFVKDIVRRESGPRSDAAGLDRSLPGRVPRRGRAIRRGRSRSRSRTQGLIGRQPRVRVHRHRPTT